MSDKRDVSTDALATLGSIIDKNAKRDAIHLAVEPVVAGETLSAGQDVGRKADGTFGSTGIKGKFLGIVDPFLRGRVHIGDRFWLIMYPRQISSLRHVWAHPDFPDEVEVKAVPMPNAKEIVEKHKKNIKMETSAWKAAKERLQEFASELNESYASLMEHATEYVESGTYWSAGDKFESIEMPIHFWDDFELVTGMTVPDKSDEWYGYFFSCSC